MVRGNPIKLASALAAFAAAAGPLLAAQPATPAADESHTRWGVIEKFCYECHNTTDWAGGAAFDAMSFDTLAGDAKVWESAVRKLRAGFMPPPGACRCGA